MEWFSTFSDWFMSLGGQYGVNPIIFGSLYVGSIPFFTLSLGWVIKNIRKGRPITLPVILTGIFFISAYLYLVVVGKNIPFWVYLVIVAMIVFGVASIINRLRQSSN